MPGIVTPELTAAFRDPVVFAAHVYELAVIVGVFILMIDEAVLVAATRRAADVSRSPKREGRRAAVDDPAVVLEAAARFLEARSRSVPRCAGGWAAAGYQPSSSRAPSSA